MLSNSMKENGNNSEKEKCFELREKKHITLRKMGTKKYSMNERDEHIENVALHLTMWTSKWKRTKIFTHVWHSTDMPKKNLTLFYEEI